MGFELLKNAARQRARTPARAAGSKTVATDQPGWNSKQFVFLDETWATANMTRLRGRSPRGQHAPRALGSDDLHCGIAQHWRDSAHGDPSHEVAGVRQAIEAVGTTIWYLPPYSPDLNPIEQLFSRLKAMLVSGQLTTPLSNSR